MPRECLALVDPAGVETVVRLTRAFSRLRSLAWGRAAPGQRRLALRLQCGGVCYLRRRHTQHLQFHRWSLREVRPVAWCIAAPLGPASSAPAGGAAASSNPFASAAGANPFASAATSNPFAGGAVKEFKPKVPGRIMDDDEDNAPIGFDHFVAGGKKAKNK